MNYYKKKNEVNNSQSPAAGAMVTVERGCDEVDEWRSLPRASETVNHDHDLPRADKKN